MYFDSNYILKCYLPEPGGLQVRELAARPVAKSCSRIGRVEVLAALHRKLREGSLTRPQFKSVCANVLADEAAGVWTWLAFDGAIEHGLEEAFLKLGAKVFLRAGDAIHLVTASLHGFQELYSHDKHVLSAAAAFGLRGIDVVP